MTALLLVLTLGLAQDHAAHGAHGIVDFKNSCTPAVQPLLQQAVASLHSFGPQAEPAFRSVLVQDPTCAIATWGIASILMTNPLAGVGPNPVLTARAQAAITQGRNIGAKTERERAYIEAIAAYYEDFANRPERARQESRAKAFEALSSKYPDDDEARIFYAVYLAATQSLSDQSYETYLRAAKMLEPLAAKYPEHPGIIHFLILVYHAPP